MSFAFHSQLIEKDFVSSLSISDQLVEGHYLDVRSMIPMISEVTLRIGCLG